MVGLFYCLMSSWFLFLGWNLSFFCCFAFRNFLVYTKMQCWLSISDHVTQPNLQSTSSRQPPWRKDIQHFNVHITILEDRKTWFGKWLMCYHSDPLLACTEVDCLQDIACKSCHGVRRPINCNLQESVSHLWPWRYR